MALFKQSKVLEKTPHDTSQFISESVQSERQRLLPGKGKSWSQTRGRDGSWRGELGLMRSAEQRTGRPGGQGGVQEP